MNDERFGKIKFTSPPLGDDKLDKLLQDNLREWSERISETQEYVVKEHLKTFVEWLALIKRVLPIYSPAERRGLVEEYVEWFINLNREVDDLLREANSECESYKEFLDELCVIHDEVERGDLHRFTELKKDG